MDVPINWWTLSPERDQIITSSITPFVPGKTRWWFQIFFIFTRTGIWQLKYFSFSPRNLGKWSILTNIFQMTWNHQLDSLSFWKDLFLFKVRVYFINNSRDYSLLLTVLDLQGDVVCLFLVCFLHQTLGRWSNFDLRILKKWIETNNQLCSVVCLFVCVLF